MDIVDSRIEDYLAGRLTRFDEPVLLEMEKEGKERGFPIVGRAVGVTLEVLARSIGAQRVVELGSGFGYSGYWFARAIGPGGELHLTDGDSKNEAKARGYLSRAGLWDTVTFHVGDAVTSLGTLDGEFDIVYCDIDKQEYPDAWRAASERIRIGGLYICDNVLGISSETILDDTPIAAAIREHNELVAADERYISTILPMRQGDMAAIRVA